MNSNEELVEHLEAVGVLKSSQLKAALLAFPRGRFVPKELLESAYVDHPLPIGNGQTISQPYTVVFMLEELNVQVGDKVLEIGAGSGWQTALLSYLVGESGSVWAYEIRHEVAEFGKSNLANFNLINIDYVEGDATKHAAGQAPYNRIIAGAGFGDVAETQGLAALLTKNGRLVAPTMNNDIRVVDRVGEDKFKEKIHYGFVFVPVVHE